MRNLRVAFAICSAVLVGAALPYAASAGELHFGQVHVGESKVLRIQGGLGLSAGSSGGGSCAKGMVTTRLGIVGNNAGEFQDIGGTYLGLHVPGNRYFEDIRFTPQTPGTKTAAFSPESTPVTPTCGLKTRMSPLFGDAVPAIHKHLLSHVHLRRHGKTDSGVSAPSAPVSRADLPANVAIYAGLSRNVYSGNSSVYGYRFLGDTCTLQGYNCNDIGFLANVYQSNDGSEIVIAFRGSAAPQTSIRDGLYATTSFNGLAMLGHSMQQRLTNDVEAAAATVRFVHGRYKHATLTLTGHSLGGAIAQVIGAASGRSAYAFNAPAAHWLFTKMAIPLGEFSDAGNRAYQNINIRIDGDQVSDTGFKMGQVLTLQRPAQLQFQRTSGSLRNAVCTEYLPTLQTLHSMDTVLDQIRHDAPTMDGSQGISFDAELHASLWCETPASLL